MYENVGGKMQLIGLVRLHCCVKWSSMDMVGVFLSFSGLCVSWQREALGSSTGSMAG